MRKSQTLAPPQVSKTIQRWKSDGIRRATRILILEDQQTDAELAIRELHRADIEFEYKRIETKVLFLKELHDFAPDLILSDYSLPQFTGLDALKLLKDLNIDIPFVLFTGSLTEEVAVECMKEGASDYILKSSLKRLPSAVKNALEASESRKAKEEALEALRKSEIEFRSIVETTNEWIWAVDLEGRITYSNPAVQQILGFEYSEVIGKYVFDFLHEEEFELAKAYFHDAIRHKRGWSQIIKRFRDSLGNIRYLESNAVPAWNSEGQLVGYRGSNRDITERKLAEDQLLHDAFHDALTGLANRPLFMTHLRLSCERERRDPEDSFAVLFLDLDRFKVINDSLGHAEGDKLLRMVAERLSGSIRPQDVVARLGGDEFTILITKLDSESDALRTIERIREALQKTPFHLNEREVFMTASIGVALSSPGPNSAEDLMRGADTAMYRAKAHGPAQYQIFDETMHQHAITQLQLETEIRSGLKMREFCLYYQPIIELTTCELLGFEALIRWNHPARGLVLPLDFIAAAEESGLILPLGHWVLEESCRQLRQWQELDSAAESLSMSVNISTKQFIQHDLADQIAEILGKTGLAPHSLKLEITESHLMENSYTAIAIMNRLRDLGISISLDDFGTGYSSLSYLHHLPVDFLKIDRSFVLRMVESADNAEIVSTIIKLARNLNLRTIAEGIETSEQLEQLKVLGCDFGQGYYFARPLETGAAREFIRLSQQNISKSHDSPPLPIDTHQLRERQHDC